MDRRDAEEGRKLISSEGEEKKVGAPEDLLSALVRLASGDLSARAARNFKRDSADTLAYFVNLMAEEIGRLLEASESNRRRLEEGVAGLNEVFLQVAAGDFAVRAPRNESGDPLDVLGYLLDNLIAEIGETFAEVERQRATLQGTFDSMADAIIIVGEGGQIETANGAASHLLGWPAAELGKMVLGQILSPRERVLESSLVRADKISPFRARNTEFLSAAGERIPLSVSGTPLSHEQGSAKRFVLVARDERELHNAQEQLQLSDRMATMGTLAAGVAHEINNPLSFVISNLEFALEELEALGDRPPSPKLRHELGRALASSKNGAERIADIVHDLKSISRVDNTSVVAVDIRRVADSAAAMLKNEVRHRARLQKAYGPTPLVRANEARVMQIVLNLVQNAAQSIAAGNAAANTIRIETSTDEEGSAVLSVTDSGSGIAPDELDDIFKTFYTTKSVGEGTGLGLSICQRLVDQLGGRIEVESTLGEGTTFRVVLPASEVAGTARSQTSPPEVAVRRLVLVVDDEREIGESVRRVLADEHDVDIATNGFEALKLFETRDYDVVLIDWMMPDMSGRQLRDEITTRFPDHRAELVAMSGGSVSLELSRSESSFIEKPFSPSKLRRLLAEI